MVSIFNSLIIFRLFLQVRMNQQQENHKFLSHFKRKLLIKRGSRKLAADDGGNRPELYHIRANGSDICTRTIQVDCNASNLNSAFCYVLRAPLPEADENGNSGWTFVWKGSKCDPFFYKLGEEVILDLWLENNNFPDRHRIGKS